MILDTQYLGSLAKQDPDARALAEEIDASETPTRIPSSVVWEIFYGPGKLTDGHATRIRRNYESLFEASTIIELDEKSARRAGTLRGKHEASNRLKSLDGADSAVAAHGLILAEPVVSNDADLQDVEGLEVVTY
ncbi:MAG: PIN domain-containing protein [Halolamina sp.]